MTPELAKEKQEIIAFTRAQIELAAAGDDAVRSRMYEAMRRVAMMMWPDDDFGGSFIDE